MSAASEIDQYAPSHAACQKIADDLLKATGASRITYRIATSQPGLAPVFVEALDTAHQPALVRLQEQPHIDLSKAHTYNEVTGQKKILLHNDCLDSPIESPKTLVTTYGCRSQMLCPGFVDGKTFSMVSVHEAKGVRDWKSEKAGDGRTMVEVLVDAGQGFLKALGKEGNVPGKDELIYA